MPRRRAKSGGETVGGRFFKGGQFVTQEALDREAGMCGMGFGAWFDIGKILRRKRRATIRTIQWFAGAVRKAAVRSLKRRKGPSPKGSPPHSKTRRLPKAIRYHVDRVAETAIVGPTFEGVGLAGAAHEFGDTFRGDRFPPRPYMTPALEETLPRIPRLWTGSIRE